MTSGERPGMHEKPTIGVDTHVTRGLIGNGGGRCPVCGSETRTSELIGGWGAWLVCQECTLEFAWPLELNQEPTRLFQDAYEGGTALNAAKDFVDRVRLREAILKKPSLWFWTPAFEMTIQWLKENLRNGGQVLEVGCGLGFMLHELRNRGFEVKAIDVAKAAVDLNRRDGFKVWHGTVNSLPDDFGEFDAVVSMFMLHHLTDPLGFVMPTVAQQRQVGQQGAALKQLYQSLNTDRAISILNGRGRRERSRDGTGPQYPSL